MGAKIWKAEANVIKFEYDFEKDGGAIGVLKLGDLPDGFLSLKMNLHVDETITSAGTPTLVVGEDGGGDDDGYFADFFGTPTIGTAVKGAGALIASDFHQVDSTKDGVQLTIGNAALTGGKVTVFVMGHQM